MKLVIIFSLITLSFIFLNQDKSLAQNMSNNNYIIYQGQINNSIINNKNKTKSSKNLANSGYQFISGFKFAKSEDPFRISSSTDLIDFGLINPTVAVLRTSKLTISGNSALNYQILVSQNQNLKSDFNDQEIPSTSCDDGACTPENPKMWKNSLTYGFGFRCDNIAESDCFNNFSQLNTFVPFLSSPSASMIAQGNLTTQRTIQVTYKANIASSQGKGIYKNIIKYIAVPNY